MPPSGFQVDEIFGTHPPIRKAIRRVLGDEWADDPSQRPKLGMPRVIDKGWPHGFETRRSVAVIHLRGFAFWVHLEEGLVASELPNGKRFQVKGLESLNQRKDRDAAKAE